MRRKRVAPMLIENFKISINSIKSSKLRSLLTILIIAIGITSLVGILTATDSLKALMNDNFGRMGANSFAIKAKKLSISSESRSGRTINRRNISYSQAMSFVDNYPLSSIISISATAVNNAVIKAASNKTNPTIRVVATDHNNLAFIGAKIEKGRNLSAQDLDQASYNAVIGSSIVSFLFKNENPIGKNIMIGAARYAVVGIIEKQGATFEGGVDSQVWIPISNARYSFLNENSFYSIGVVPLYDEPEFAIDKAREIFRSIRRLSPSDPSDFEITKSDAMMENISNILSYVTIAAFIIGAITLLGAAVGLMNIMLVSVKERTREIGTRKALGASSNMIKQQFLFESILIGQLGGAFGIFLGIIIGNITAVIMGSPFVVPWLWILSGVTLCFIVSITSGYIPATRAANLDPIEALRYE